MFDYAFLPSRHYADYGDYYGPFWAYDYGDLFGGVFLPYASASAGTGTEGPATAQPAAAAAPPCASDAQTAVAPPITRIADAVQPSPAQRAKLDALQAAEAKAAKVVAAACPTQVPATPVARLDLARQRLEAMLQSIDIARPALDDLYASLDDERKARLNALGQAQANAAPAQACGAPVEGTSFPLAAIEAATHLDDAQRAKLLQLRDAAARAADTISAACPTALPLTPPGRLGAERNRIEAMLQSIDAVRPPLQTFYDSLNDQQKASFTAVTQQQASQG